MLPTRAGQVVRRSLVVTLLVGTAGLVAMLLLAHPIVTVLFGRAFTAHVARLVMILALAVLPNYFNSWASNVLISNDHFRTVVRIQSVLVVLNVSTNVALLPRYGVDAAAWVTLLTEAAGAVVYLGLVLTRPLRPRWLTREQ